MFSNKSKNSNFVSKASIHFSEVWEKKEQNGQIQVQYIPGENERIDKTLKLITSGERILDIGCGTGLLGSQLKSNFHDIYGIDIAEFAVERARENGVGAFVLNVNEEALPFSENYFDSVTVLSVMQYFVELDFVIGEIWRVLKPNGLLILSFPNMRAWWRISKLLFLGVFPRTSCDPVGWDGGALHYFCHKDVTRLFLKHNFQILSTHGIICIPRFITIFPDKTFLGSIKREFFSAEIITVFKKNNINQ